MERDGSILMQSVSPNQAAVWIADKVDALGDPEFRAIHVKLRDIAAERKARS